MTHEVTLYGGIYTYSIERFIKAIGEAGDDPVIVRVNTDGGNPMDGWSAVARIRECVGKVTVKVDGRANSAGAFMLLYCDSSEALDVSTFVLHRASFGSYVEESVERFTEEMKAYLKIINDSLRKAMEARLNIEKFEKITGKTLDDLFSMESRIDVTLTAQQAKSIGLIDKIVKLTPEVRASIESKFSELGMAANLPTVAPAAKSPKTVIDNPNPTTMTLEQFKNDHPEVYAEAIKAGVNQERDRIGAYMVYADVDLKRVQEGIESGEPLTAKAQAELNRQATTVEAKKDVKKDSPKDVPTDEPKEEPKAEDDKRTDEEIKAEADFDKALNEELGIKSEDDK